VTDPSSIVELLKSGYGVAAVALIALAYVFKLYVGSQNDHLATVREITPIAAKLAEGAEALERMMVEVRKG
jgi:hypothetical protein